MSEKRYSIPDLAIAAGIKERRVYYIMRGVPSSGKVKSKNNRTVDAYTLTELKARIAELDCYVNAPPQGYACLADMRGHMAIDGGRFKAMTKQKDFPKPDGVYYSRGKNGRPTPYYSIEKCLAFLDKYRFEFSTRIMKPISDENAPYAVPAMDKYTAALCRMSVELDKRIYAARMSV